VDCGVQAPPEYLSAENYGGKGVRGYTNGEPSETAFSKTEACEEPGCEEQNDVGNVEKQKWEPPGERFQGAIHERFAYRGGSGLDLHPRRKE
jgi:hypothetical protein